MLHIPISKVWLGEEEMNAVVEPLRSGWIDQGAYVAEFEEKFARFTGSRHAIATTSCTAALHLSLAAADVQPGDEVVIPAFASDATANVVEYIGAQPVFCDIDLETYNLDVELLPDLLSERTRAIIPVHLFGLASDMHPIRRLARWHDLYVVEDAACGFGSIYKGHHVGTLSHFGCFSFHPRKVVTTGEGGMLLTQSDAAAERCRRLRDDGAGGIADDNLSLAAFDRIGYNYRMTDMQGAVGSTQMDRAEAIRAARVARAGRYDELLASTSWLRRPTVPEDTEHAYESYVCLYRPEAPSIKNVNRLQDGRNELMRKLKAHGIATRQGAHNVTSLGYYRRRYHLEPERYPNALLAEKLSFALPLYPQMTDEEQDYVVQNLQHAFESYRRAA